MRLVRLGSLIDAFRPAEGPPPQRLAAFMRWCLRGSWPMLWMAAALSALSGTFEVVSAAVIGWVIDAAVASDPAAFFTDHLGLLSLFLIFYLVLRPLSFGLSSAANSIVIGPNVLPLVLSRLHRWTLGQAVTFFDNDFAGRIAQKQMQAARAVTDAVTEIINTVAFALASVVASALYLLSVDWRIAAALGLWLLAYMALIRFYLPKVRENSAARAAARAMVSGQVVDTITNIKTVKLFAHAAFEDRVALRAMETFRDRSLEFGVISTWFRFALMALSGVLPVLLIGGTLVLWQQGAATAGSIAAAGAIATRISQMSGWVSFTLMSIYTSIGEVEDGMRTLSVPHELPDRDGAVDLPRVRGEIRFEAVSFAYGRQTGGIRALDLTVRPGEKLGIVGASGAGKSTLVSLLLRLYDPEEGRVLIDGQDVRGVTQESLRRQIAMVTQETAMFNRSARDNIMYGRPDASEDEMVAAARAAEADEFIAAMVDHSGRRGYDAFLGERGVKLSGGQRQRIALARAFLKDAPILVLDEATSALDSEVEASIQEALGRVMEGKTVLAIAHRLSTIAAMDRIIVLDRGELVEEGTHETLLARNGLYARYWNRQSGGFMTCEEEAAE
ncbi:ABC transporter ATP-binding protein/permease [Cereibacter sphaeroides]|uniref:ABC transporter ATP-binding protein n=1 Tax=Cereibacter sphaeroides TaxID=1063 RepID=UPI001F317B43|nr:ABC transporter ATP-binding protein [Cereibacter sphaeroides]MCE6961047.1 ABC transporter ATP-binding protein/permease [Cereibacter sphaeroides]MCE6969655.1 ABC transporter ATP-binding protein/permease [Cereibacter sphaeroides]MCE6975130.1 ABC transporter ATP-binding protein/permease [Cereibacter sphaeroides]